MKYLIIIGVIILILIVWVIITYNNLVKLKNMVRDQWSQIDVQLKQRFDLIPNLVEVVKGYARHEQDTLTKVVEARNNAVNAKTKAEEIKANDEMMRGISKLFVLSESYPELKANQNFINLQDNLREIEEKIGYARQFYNDMVLKYNNKRDVFPTILIAGILGFKSEEFFEISNNEKENINIKF